MCTPSWHPSVYTTVSFETECEPITVRSRRGRSSCNDTLERPICSRLVVNSVALGRLVGIELPQQGIVAAIQTLDDPQFPDRDFINGSTDGTALPPWQIEAVPAFGLKHIMELIEFFDAVNIRIGIYVRADEACLWCEVVAHPWGDSPILIEVLDELMKIWVDRHRQISGILADMWLPQIAFIHYSIAIGREEAEYRISDDDDAPPRRVQDRYNSIGTPKCRRIFHVFHPFSKVRCRRTATVID